MLAVCPFAVGVAPVGAARTALVRSPTENAQTACRPGAALS